MAFWALGLHHEPSASPSLLCAHRAYKGTHKSQPLASYSIKRYKRPILFSDREKAHSLTQQLPQNRHKVQPPQSLFTEPNKQWTDGPATATRPYHLTSTPRSVVLDPKTRTHARTFLVLVEYFLGVLAWWWSSSPVRRRSSVRDSWDRKPLFYFYLL
jgi:hypothetical protein